MENQGTMTKTADELQKEIEERQNALAELEAKQREAARAEKAAAYEKAQIAERLNQREITTVIAEKLVSALIAAGFNNAYYEFADVKTFNGGIPVIFTDKDEHHEQWGPCIERGYNGSTRGKFVICVGRWGTVRRYPPLKAGGYNYTRIAAVCAEIHTQCVEGDKIRATHAKNQKISEKVVERLNTKFGKPAYPGAQRYIINNVDLTPSKSVPGTVKIEVDFKMFSVPEAKAVEALDILITAMKQCSELVPDEDSGRRSDEIFHE